MTLSSKSIWIDLDNSPHVPLFLPIIKHYRDAGVEVILTARDHSQTIELLDLAGLSKTYEVIGRHAGGSKIRKVLGLADRTLGLVNFIRKKGKPAVALSHGSRSMVLAARFLRIPIVTMYDYEFTETRIFNRFSTRVLVPEGIDDAVLDRIGLPLPKRYKYPGLKEELYVRAFLPDAEFPGLLASAVGAQVEPDKVLVVLRPPASTANYHDPRSDSVFAAILNFLAAAESAFTIIVPRTGEQAVEIRERFVAIGHAEGSFAILEKAVSGLDLINTADIVISGGGTMNREAALLGVPVYSIFQGEQGSLDRTMERRGEITFIRSETDIEKLILKKRDGDTGRKPLSDRVEQFVRKHIDFFLANGTNG